MKTIKKAVKAGEGQWAISYRRIFFIILFSLTYNLLPIAYSPSYCLLPIAYSPSYSFAQEQKQQPQQQESFEEERLSIIKSDIQKEVEHNEKLKKEIEEAQKNIDENTKERLLKVSKIYEAMPPEEAAKRLEKLDENTAVDIISMLKPRAAGGILAQMDSDKAASISKKIITKGKK
jgi:flagellar motility protein MotE (MotC chaperone)